MRSLLPLLLPFLFIGIYGCKSRSHSDVKIYDGQIVEESDPIAKSIVQISGGPCTAGIIAPKVLLTAAHCVTDDNLRPKYTVTFRTQSRSATNVDKLEILTSTNVVVHPQYDAKAEKLEQADSDIALIMLNEEQSLLNGYIPLPIAAPNFPIPDPATERVVGVLAGFGFNNLPANPAPQPIFGILMKTKSTLTDVTKSGRLKFVAGEGEGALCGGDSGGPGFFETANGFVVVGVNIMSGCSKGFKDGKWSILNDVRFYHDWIRGTIAKTGFEQPKYVSQ
ncbi:MAG: trypsin-like serine protease [Oligoflexales bacterium]